MRSSVPIDRETYLAVRRRERTQVNRRRRDLRTPARSATRKPGTETSRNQPDPHWRIATDRAHAEGRRSSADTRRLESEQRAEPEHMANTGVDQYRIPGRDLRRLVGEPALGRRPRLGRGTCVPYWRDPPVGHASSVDQAGPQTGPGISGPSTPGHASRGRPWGPPRSPRCWPAPSSNGPTPGSRSRRRRGAAPA